MYRLLRISTTVRLALLLAVASALLGACTTTPPTKPAVTVAGKSDVDLLFDAAAVSCRERGLEVDHASREHRIVTSTYQKVSERLRRRFTARIIRLPGGANGLRVKVDYQRRFGEGKNSAWKMVESRPLRERAAEAELELARTIEKRYRRWREYRDEHTDAGTGGGGADAGGPARTPGRDGPEPREPASKPSFGPGE